MKRRLVLFCLALVLSLSLTACLCNHGIWEDATCDTPKTCVDCGATEGNPLGHTWQAATCTTPKTCEVCGATEGQAKGHAWTEAACEAPKTCSGCNLTEGSALGHIWQEATTEAPKTCATCSKTEGTKIEVDSRFTTAATKAVQGKWGYEFPMTGDMMNLPDFDEALTMRLVMELSNDGVIKIYVEIVNEQSFRDSLLSYMVDATYKELLAKGLSKSDADAAFQQQYGMGVEAYMRKYVSTIDFASLVGSSNITGVYYVFDGKIYAADTWADAMDPMEFTLSGDTLTLMEDLMGDGSKSVVLQRMS